jgi:hypothetical protein
MYLRALCWRGARRSSRAALPSAASTRLAADTSALIRLPCDAVAMLCRCCIVAFALLLL